MSDRIRLRAFTVGVLILCGAATDAITQDLLPRRPLPKGDLSERVNPRFEQRLAVKFVDGVKARAAVDGTVSSLTAVDVASVQQVAQRLGLTFSKLIHLPDADLRRLEERAAALSGVAQPDLAGMMHVDLKVESSENLLAAGNALQALEVVEYAEIISVDVPLPSHDPAPPSASFVECGHSEAQCPPTNCPVNCYQAYRGPDPGIDVDFAWAQGAGKGAGIRFSHLENQWNIKDEHLGHDNHEMHPGHEDLHDVPVNVEPGQTPIWSSFPFFRNHGTAVLGIVCAKENGYGCSGLAPDADLWVFPRYSEEEPGDRLETIIAKASLLSSPGDVILMTMQGTLLVTSADRGGQAHLRPGQDGSRRTAHGCRGGGKRKRGPRWG